MQTYEPAAVVELESGVLEETNAVVCHRERVNVHITARRDEYPCMSVYMYVFVCVSVCMDG
jgi:hypothetical protein